MFTFNTPCLRWKLVLAQKNQYGWPGFIAPYENRYLTKLVVITTTPSFGGPGNVRTQQFHTDRITGNITPLVNLQANADFPYGLPLPTNDPNDTWDVSETEFTNTINNGEFIIETQVTLSNQYDLATLDADADNLLGQISVANMPWGTLQFNSDNGVSVADGPFSPDGNLFDDLPPQVGYGGFFLGGPIQVPLNAVAAYVYVPGFVTSTTVFPNGYLKLIGYVAMAGSYCLKTTILDWNMNVLNTKCQSGTGSCASASKITPPPLTVGQNAYTLFEPNCQCGV